MARLLKPFVPRLLYHRNTVCFSTASHSLFSSHLPTTSHRCNLSDSVERLRNIWISGLVDPNKMSRYAMSCLYSARVQEMHEELACEKYRRKVFYGDDTRQLAFTLCYWKHHKIHIFDFHNEIQKALRFIDGAVLVLSSVLGVQRVSTVVDQHMKGYEIPRLVFIDKLDKKGANPWNVLNQVRSKLGHHSAAIHVPIGLEHDFKGLVDLVQLKAYSFIGEDVVDEEIPADMEALVLDKRRELIETVSEVDNKLAEAFRSRKTISSADLKEAVRRATIAQKFIPILMGSALKKGPQPLLDGVLNYLPCPIEVSKYSLDRTKNGEKLHGSPNGPLVASAVTFDLWVLGAWHFTCLRIYEGVLREGDCIINVRTGEKHWVHRLCMHDNKDIQEAHAGQIIFVDNRHFGVLPTFCAPGDTFTNGLVVPPMDVREHATKDSKGNKKRNSQIHHQELMKLLSKHVHGE